MALGKEMEIYAVNEGKTVKWSDWVDVRDGSVLEVLCLLRGGGRQKKKKIMARNPWAVLVVAGNENIRRRGKLGRKW